MTNAATFRKVAPYALVGAAAGYLYYLAANFQYHARAGTLGPDFWPKAILVLMIAVCAYEIAKIIFSGGAAQDAGGVLEDMVEKGIGKHGDAAAPAAPIASHPGLLLAGMGATLLYVAASQRLGFFLATIVYLVAFMWLGGYRRWRVIAAVSVVGTLVLLFIFMKLVYVSLPIGVAPFSEVTLLLMKLMGIR
jgi:putative tricarboxylic transport membrane protein